MFWLGLTFLNGAGDLQYFGVTMAHALRISSHLGDLLKVRGLNSRSETKLLGYVYW